MNGPQALKSSSAVAIILKRNRNKKKIKHQNLIFLSIWEIEVYGPEKKNKIIQMHKFDHF